MALPAGSRTIDILGEKHTSGEKPPLKEVIPHYRVMVEDDGYLSPSGDFKPPSATTS